MNRKLNKKKVIIVTLLIIIIIAIIGFGVFKNVWNNEENQVENVSEETENTENVISTSNTLVLQIPEENQVDEIWEWQHDTLENHNINISAINSVHNTIDDYPINAELIVKNGVIVDEYYKEEYDKNSVFTLQSTSKSITSAILGIAIDKGYIENVNIPISNYFPQILEANSEYLKEITIWHLLTHTSGFSASDTANWYEWRASENWIDYVLNSPVTSRPGTVFNYFTGNTHLLSAIVEKATGKTLYEFGKENLFDKLDMDSVECGADPQGISDGGNGFAMNIYDMAKLGELYLNKGNWNGEQIISEQWINDSTNTQFERNSGSADYGYQWWVRTFGDNDYPAFFAQGHYGQYIFVVPDLNLVVALTSHYEGSSSIYWQIMNNIVNACEN